MEKINWGIIGCGDVTEVKSGPAFNRVENSALVAVMRRNAGKAKDYARRHGVPRWYDDADQLINDPGVNAIYVATPPSSHEKYALAAIAAGKPVYVEKPMAVDLAAARRMEKAAARANVKLVVAHYRRKQPRFRKVKELIDGSAVGKVLLVRLELNKPPITADERANPNYGWRILPEIAGGGLFHDLGTHQLDLMYYLFGPAARIEGIAVNQMSQYDAADLVAGNILFENGIIFSGTWCFNAAHESEKDHCEIIGTDGSIRFPIFSGDNLVIEASGERKVLRFDPLPHAQQPMIDATVRYFLGEAANPDSGAEGAEIMRWIEALVNPSIP